MINVEKPMVTDLYIPRSDGSGGGKPSGKKDIETILEGYVKREDFEREIARLEALININPEQ